MSAILLIGEAAGAPDLIGEGLRFTHQAGVYLGCVVPIYVVLLFGGRALKRRFRLPLSWVYHLFCMAAALYIPTVFPFVEFPGEEHIGAALTLIAAFLLVGFVRHYLFDHILRNGRSRQVPKFLGEFVSIAIMVGALLFILQFFYKVEVPGLLAGAGIVGIVLGLALQDTLGNIFSGFAIYFGGQFKAGDWLLVDGQHAKIVEINWRSTRLQTIDELCLDIPNSNITKETVTNYNFPSSVHAVRLEIGLEYDAPPSRVREVLIEAALDCPHVLCEPRPDVFLTEFGDWSITYQLRYWLGDHTHYDAANSHIRTTLWYALRRAKITIPYPIQHELSLEHPQPVVEDRDEIRNSLRKAVFAPALSPAQLEQLVDRSRIVRFGKGESLIRQGAEAGPMYVLVSGRAEVWVDSNGFRTAVAVLGPDACIGENSVLTGEPRSATILALEDCLAVQVEKSTLAPLIAASPDLLEFLSELLARRRMENEGLVAEAAGSAPTATNISYKAGILGKLRAFFEV